MKERKNIPWGFPDPDHATYWNFNEFDSDGYLDEVDEWFKDYRLSIQRTNVSGGEL